MLLRKRNMCISSCSWLFPNFCDKSYIGQKTWFTPKYIEKCVYFVLAEHALYYVHLTHKSIKGVQNVPWPLQIRITQKVRITLQNQIHINQSINQSINQPINQLIKQASNSSPNRHNDVSDKKNKSWYVTMSICRRINQPTNHSINHKTFLMRQNQQKYCFKAQNTVTWN